MEEARTNLIFLLAAQCSLLAVLQELKASSGILCPIA